MGGILAKMIKVDCFVIMFSVRIWCIKPIEPLYLANIKVIGGKKYGTKTL
ncbi:hypothetical protein J2S17_001081 [Cytobacillus purgationiresistens]|uniref:Uncharacterized protein n=1 Tax=Cytobacillus purgationiresistens TaxID=863449 RepID=A0ABU0AEP8_9BACI|nr:hypothetical protein [Cytobacillus purgationiresistens]